MNITPPTTQVLVFLIRIRRKGRQEVALAQKLRGTDKGLWAGYNMLLGTRRSHVRGGAQVLAEQASVVAEIKLLHKYACMEFCEAGGNPLSVVHVYLCRHWNGNPKRTDDMGLPSWFLFQNIPYHEMLHAYQLFLPRILAGEKIMCRFVLSKDQAYVSKNSIQPVDTF